MSPRSYALVVAAFAFSASAMKPHQQSTFLAMNMTGTGRYGKEKCPCVGVDNMKGFINFRSGLTMQKGYPADMGSSCKAWDQGRYSPGCDKKDPASWCAKEWCYVDPCNCDLEILPKQTTSDIKYQGSTAYWSYNTCGEVDSFSSESADKDWYCVNQDTEDKCSKLNNCAWDGKQCGGLEAVKTCKEAKKLDEAIVGEEDCRCIGLDNKDGKVQMYINATHEVDYPADVGGSCQAWEKTTHPACMKKGGDTPSWCNQKWCFVDPCKCKTKKPPSAVMPANAHMKFQGNNVHWSYEACGGVDTFSSSHKDMYCSSQKSALDCTMLDKCTWTGKQCLSKEVAEICSAGDHKSGSSSPSTSAAAFILTLGTLATM